MAESGRLERHDRSRALVSSEARHPGRFALPGAMGGDRRTVRYAQTGAAVISPPNCVPHPRFELGTSSFWGKRLYQFGLERHESGYRESDPGLHHGKVTRCHCATSAWSPSLCRAGRRVHTRDARTPIRRARVGEARFGRAPYSFKGYRASYPIPIKSPSPGSNWAGCPYKGPPDAGPKGAVRSAGVEPASTWLSTKPVYLIAARAHGAATRCRPGSPALRGRGRSRARRRSSPSWPRTTNLRHQRPALCQLS
jgi:hypothetical protein